MVTPISQIAKPTRPANRDQGAWYENAYQRESALDLAKRLIEVTNPREKLSAHAVTAALRNICAPPAVAKIADLPTRFETRLAFYQAVLARAQFSSNPAANEPNIAWALAALSEIGAVFFSERGQHGWARVLKTPHQIPIERALKRWTGIDARQHGEGRGLDAEQISTFWTACLKAAAWQRAISAVRHPTAQPVTPDHVNATPLAETFEEADQWRFSQPSNFSIGGSMPTQPAQNPFPLNDGDAMITTPDGITVHAAAALRESTQALDEDTGDFDLPPEVADQITREIDEIDEEDAALQQRTQDEPLDPEPDDEETPRQFRERLGRILQGAGVRDLRAAFKRATGYGSFDAAIGAGISRQEIEEQIVAYADTQKNAPPSTPKTQSHTETPKTQSERPAAPKSGQNAALLPMGDTPEASEFAFRINQAQMFLKSGLLPASIKTVEQVITLAAMGEQLGISPIAAINGIDVIQGRPSIKPDLMLALIYKSRELEDLQVTDDGETCTVVMTRKGMTPHTEKFSMKDAAAMNLLGKDNWRKQPGVMRKKRAIAAAARIVFPDVIWGFGVRS